MKTNTAIHTLCVIAILAALFFWGYNNRPSTAASVQNVDDSQREGFALEAPETVYDFGSISMKDGNVQKEFTITNISGKDVRVTSVVTSCMCTTAYIVRPDGGVNGPFGMPGHGGSVPPANEDILAGESRIIRVIYDPNAHGPAGVGAIDRFITLTDESGGVLRLEIRAVVTP